jgi:glucose-6-phosphate isomerase
MNPLGRHPDLLLTNMLAEAEALTFGKTSQEVQAEGTPAWMAPHPIFEDNRPSNIWLEER